MWFAFGSYLTLAIALVRSIILARILAPEAFGVIAFSLFLVSLFGIVRNLGQNYALIHKKDPDPGTLSTYFWINTGLSLLALVLTILAYPLLAQAYGIEIGLVTIALAGVGVIQAVYGLPQILLEKDLQFARVTMVNITAAVTKSVIPIWLALSGWGVWALVAVEVIDALTRMVMSTMMKPVFPRAIWSREAAGFFWDYGKRIWSSGIAGVVVHQFNNFLVGTVSGLRSLGFYSKAAELGAYPTMLTSSIVSRVTLPTYAKLQGDRAGLSRAYELVLGAIMRASAWLGLVLVVGVHEFTLILLGERWLPIVPIVQVLSIFVVLRPAVDDSVAVLAATGRPGLLSRLMWAQAIVLLVAGPLLTRAAGAMGAAAALDLAIFVGLALFYTVFIREIVTISVHRVFLPPLLSAALAAAATYLLSRIFLPDDPAVAFVAEVAIASAIYWAVLLLWERKRISRQIDYIREIMARPEPAPEPAPGSEDIYS